MTVMTRIAPSPTGYMHIGTARTALFNYLFAKNQGGKFLIRVEDTDKERSTQEAVDVLLDGMKWFGLTHDDDIVFQSHNIDRHIAIAKELVEKGAAYYCYTSKKELESLREAAQEKGEHFRFQSPWRDADPATAPSDQNPVIRIKAPKEGQTTIDDAVQGQITVQNDQLDDFILLRQDGTPTYMLSVVVDDHDMAITHVIRGDDHLNNMFRQKVIFDAMGWNFPVMAHIPLIHGEDGKKLSKRRGAAGLREFADLGYLPEGLRNYLLRLGWSHGDDEVISDDQAIAWFSDLSHINKAPARMDLKKLNNINSHYIKQRSPDSLLPLFQKNLEENIGRPLSDDDLALIKQALPDLQERAQTLPDLASGATFYVQDLPLPLDDRAQKALAQDHAKDVLNAMIDQINSLSDITKENAHTAIEAIMEKMALKMGKVGPVIRAAVCGTMNAPDLSSVLHVLGKARVLERLEKTYHTL